MTKTHELERDRAHDVAARHHVDWPTAPGRATRTQDLVGPNGPMASGLVLRRARDANGVTRGADVAVAEANASSGAPLPEQLMRKFETSLGADLSNVRVHTGGASEQAANAVGARAYALGQDIHFAAGEYDPSSHAGQHLLAHEVAHTVQATAGPRFKLEVSTPGDAHELEADRAASAMVSGASFAIAGVSRVVSRDPARPGNPSYSNGNPNKIGPAPARNGETEHGDSKEEVKNAVDTLKGSAIGKAGLYLATAASVRLEPMTFESGLERRAVVKNGKVLAELEAELAARDNDKGTEASGKHGIDVPIDAKGKTKTVFLTKHLETARNQLKRQCETAAWIFETSNVVNDAASQTNQFLGMAIKVNNKACLIKPEHFDTASGATEKIQEFIKAIDEATKICDKTALDEFQKNPDFDSAAAWGDHIGSIFDGLAPLGAAMDKALPGGGEGPGIMEGMFKVPHVVIDQFTAVVQSRYQRIDEKTQDCGAKTAELLPDGGEGQSCRQKD